MAGVPRVYRKSGESAIASYSYTDLAEGTGIVDYYGFAMDSGSGTKVYKLTTNTGIYSAAGSTAHKYGQSYYTVAGGASGSQEINFDLQFNQPQRMKGNVIINAQVVLALTNPGSNCYFKFKLYKYDGSTETAISSQITTETITQVSGSDYPFFSVVVPLTALTHFKKGETFRVEAIIYYALSTNSTFFIVYHSPSDNQAGSNLQTTRFIVSVPFVIDI